MSETKVITRFNKDVIEQSVVSHDDLERSSHSVIDLREEGVVRALVKLGWTPPATGGSYIMEDHNRPKGVF